MTDSAAPAKLGVIRLPAFPEENGTLRVLEFHQLTTPISRFFMIHAKAGDVRGDHAHRRGWQYLLAAAGAVTVDLVDQQGSQTVHLSDPDSLLIVPPLVWATERFATDGALIVLCDLPYAEADYIRDRAEFDSLMSAIRGSGN